MPTCSFCKKHYKEPRGLTVFTFDGRSVHFCSSKCRRNLDLKRDPKKVNWIKREKKVKIDKKIEEKNVEKNEEKVVEKLEEKQAEKTEKSTEKPEEKKSEKKE